MKAAWISNGKLDIRDIPKPEPGPGQALLKPLIAGICNTDLELLAGYYGFEGVAGHEFVAEVVQAPDDPSWVGKRVTADINIGCGKCEFCLRGNQRHCIQRQVIGIKYSQGAFAEYLCAPVANLIEVPGRVDDQTAVFCEPLAAALEVSQQVHIIAGHKMAVVGDGKLGLLVALGLALYNPGLLLLGKHPEKLALAENQGIRTRLVRADEDWGRLADELGRFDIVVEATGRPDGINKALELVKSEGVLVAKTTSHLPSEINLARIVVDEIQIIGSRCGDMALALNHLARGTLDVLPLIDSVFDFGEMTEAFERAATPGAGKVLVRFAQS